MTRGIGVVAFVMCAISSAQAQVTKPNQIGAIEANKKAELRAHTQIQKEVARELAPVKSQADLYQQLQQNTRGMSALRKMSPTSYRLFIDSLVFNERGLASFDYKSVEDELSVSEAYDLLSMFGVQHTVRYFPGLKIKTKADLLVRQMVTPLGEGLDEGQDHHDFSCTGRANCEYKQRNICMSSC